jgi:carboxyl-terminal processing protease
MSCFTKVRLTMAVVLWISMNVAAQPSRNYRDEAQTMKGIFLQLHVAPPAFDNVYSTWLFDHFLKKLDPEKIYFTLEDIRELEAHKFKLDDEVNGTTWQFLPATLKAFKVSLARADGFVNEILNVPTDLNQKQKYSEDSTYASSADELKARWKRKLKLEMLTRLYELRKTNATGDDQTFLKTNESAVRQRVKISALRSIKKTLEPASGFDDHISTIYLQSIASAFDPHSNYLSATEIENFLASMSSKGYYFGISLDESDQGEIVIEQLTPGGPAWKSGALNGGDVIRKLRWEGQDPIELDGMSLDEVEELLLDTNHDVMEFTVSKAGGYPQTVSLRKEKMDSEEQVVKSFILRGSQKSIGYISLPGFYTNWGEEGAARCASDVAREIIKLKKENIQGLILDLRFNGGGSLPEAVSMAGIFIDAGPVGVLRNKAGYLTTLKDMNRGTVYDGPLVIVVNSLSASASEFLAAALQDHQRAIVVGSSTYGKATAQVLFEVAKASPPKPMMGVKPGAGFCSVTLEKIYRITGKTAQAVGVKPDVFIPDIYDELPIHERNLVRRLSSDSVVKKMYYQPLPRGPVDSVRIRSEKRVQRQVYFQNVTKAGQLLADMFTGENNLPLNWPEFKKESDVKNAPFVSVSNKNNSHGTFTVSHHQFELQRMEMDSFFADLNKAWVKKLSQDFSLAESFHIICDYIDLSVKK